MKKILVSTLFLSILSPVWANSTEDLKQQIQQLKKDYEQRTQALEERIKAAEDSAISDTSSAQQPAKNNSFNPAVSLILNGTYSSYSQSPDNYVLPGFALGEEAGLDKEGFSLSESEITLSANTDQYWRGQMTMALADDDGETSVELEEAYVETLGLGNGLKLRAGRFYSGIGYLNSKHSHAWNFNDAPLVYRGLFGNQLKQDGLRLNWTLPTDQYIETGLEVGNGQSFPVGGSHSGIGDWAVYAKTGGDFNDSQSWQLGVSHLQANDIEDRTTDTHSFSGDSKLHGIDFVYKWSPNGNDRERSLVLQGEYFKRSEDGSIDVDGTAGGTISGDQTGWYVEGIYKFKPRWKAGLRYDNLSSDNSGSDRAVIQQAGLDAAGFDPHRSSAMVEWTPSEFSRIRLQLNQDNSTRKTDNQVILQYTQALGSHGAHSY